MIKSIMSRFVVCILACLFVGEVSPAWGADSKEDVLDVLNDRSVDLRNPVARAAAVQRMKGIEMRQLAHARNIARQRGKPLRRSLDDGTFMELVGINRDGELLYYFTRNKNAAISSAANKLHATPYSEDGDGITVGVWDAGSALVSHNEFNDGPSSRVVNKDGVATHYHATHVAGTVAAYGASASAKGMAPAATVDSYDWFSDFTEMLAAGATAAGQSTKIYLSNHSYGYGYGWQWNGSFWTWNGSVTGTDQNAYDHNFGQYSYFARTCDSTVYDTPYYVPFWSAGNESNDGPSNGNTVEINGSSTTYNSSIHPPGDGVYRNGFETIGDFGVAKNVITIGAANDAVTGNSRVPSKATKASFSSTGPVDDGRIKPDLMGNGVSLYSTYDTSDSAYASMSGTSMSSPNVCGSAALLVARYSDLFSGGAMRASTLKGLLIHTATDIGNPGPDYTYGWGLVDVETAAELLHDHATYPERVHLNEDQVNTTTTTRTHDFTWDGSSPIRATLCWTDPPGTTESDHDNRTPDLVNDLNLKIIAPDGTTEYLPFVMPFVGTWTVASMSQNATTGTNHVDNVEQVLIASPGQSGTWQAVVSYIGSLTDGAQDYALLISGSTTPVATPGFTLSKTTATVAENGGTDSFTVVLDAEPATDVVLDISSSATGEATVSPASLTFTSGNWDSAQSVTITGVNDDTLGNDAATVTVSVNDASSDNAFDALADQTVAVTCTDDDTAQLTVSIAAASISESAGAGATTATVTRNTDTTAELVVTLVSDDTSEATVPASVTIAAGQATSAAFDIDAVDDALQDGTQTVTITASAAAHADGSDTVDVTDDEGWSGPLFRFR